MTIWTVTCLLAFLWLLWLLRVERRSFGLPVAYLLLLLLIHMPGALAREADGDVLLRYDPNGISMMLTALGSVSFVAGVYLALIAVPQAPVAPKVDRPDYWWFCLLGGWCALVVSSVLPVIPSVGAVIDKGAALWMLGVMLGLKKSLSSRDLTAVGIWSGALLVFPVLMLFLGGFVGFGFTAIIIVSSGLAIATRRLWWVVAVTVVSVFVGLSVSVTYLQHRSIIREQVWGGRPLEARIESVVDAARDFEWLDLGNESHLKALDDRLNQNNFVDLAYHRIQDGQVDYLFGRSIWEGVLALIPRLLWPDKPVFGGSPAIVREMTGLRLSETTSWGVGVIMESYINFGVPGVIGVLLVVGCLIGILDRKGAIAERHGDLGSVALFFVPAVASIQPGGSMVEMAGGMAAAVIAAHGWRWAWNTRLDVASNGVKALIPHRVFPGGYAQQSMRARRK